MVTHGGACRTAAILPLRHEQLCLPAPFSAALERLFGRIGELAACERCWIEKICAGLLACLELLDEEPALAQALLLDEQLTSLAERACTQRLKDALGPVLERARSQVIVGCELLPAAELLAELVISGALALTRSQLRKGRPLIALAPALMAYIVEPYLGAGAAQDDCDGRPSPAVQAEVVPIRPTPGTLGVLSALEERPGLRCLELRLAAGLRSMDRTREIVRRLRQRGLIESTSKGGRAASALRLTPYGRRILQLADQRLVVAA